VDDTWLLVNQLNVISKQSQNLGKSNIQRDLCINTIYCPDLNAIISNPYDSSNLKLLVEVPKSVLSSQGKLTTISKKIKLSVTTERTYLQICEEIFEMPSHL